MSINDLPEILTFVDIETTGCNLFHDRIIEVGILRVENGKLIDTYETLINPETRLSLEIQKLTGISSNDLENAPTFSSVKKDILPLFADAIFVAHNARFDYGFLRQEFKREGVSFKSKQLCTCKLSKALYPRYKHHNLDAIIERFGFACGSRHRALGDAKILWDFYQHITKNVTPYKMGKAVSKVLKRPTVPLHLSVKLLDDLPDAPGVYIFYGENGMPLYVGKSISIRDRVLSHFSGDLESGIEMKIAQQVKRIETKITAGELGALIAESSLIKKLQPLYNRKLRHVSKLVILKKKQNNNGYFTVKIEEVVTIKPTETGDILGIFRSKRQAHTTLLELARKYTLCQKILGIEHGKGACFGYGLGWCKGACMHEEKVAFYNARFVEAFFEYKIRTWPFPGAVVVAENSIDGGSDRHIIDKWCYMGKVSTDGENVSPQLVNDITFDVDMYKILERYLLRSKRSKQISLVEYASLRTNVKQSFDNEIAASFHSWK